MNTPTALQMQALNALNAGPLVLFCEYSYAAPGAAEAATAALAKAAKRFGGALKFAGAEQQVLCGQIALHQQCASLHFSMRDGARGFVESAEVRVTLAKATALQVTVLSEMPRVVGVLSWVLSKLMPVWPFDNSTDSSEEPGIGTSVMPSRETIESIRHHPEQDRPVTMVNFLKFRPRADYKDGRKPVSGREAYHAYGKVAMTTTHSLGAKLLYAARYFSTLIGNGGDPGIGRWDEFALMQYPGRKTFGQMAQLRRYRAGLHHRAAGLAEHGQGLTLTYPAPQFTWKR